MNIRKSFGLAGVLVLLLLFTDSLIYAQNWPMVNANKERTSWASKETTLYPPLEQKKEIAVKSEGDYIVLNYITVYENLLALGVGRYPNVLEAADISSGDTLWTFEVPESRASMNFACAQNDSMIFAGGQQGLGLYALNKSTGELKWSKPMGTLYTKSPILDNEYLYILGDSLYCLSIKDGATIWSKYLKIQGTPTVDDLYAYIIGKGKIQLFDKMTGELEWWKPNTQNSGSGLTLDDQCFYTFSSDTIYAHVKESKNIKWFFHNPGHTIICGGQNAFAVAETKLCITMEDTANSQVKLVTLNKENGELLWDHTFSGNWLYTPTIANGVVYIVSVEGDLYAFDLETGTQMFYDNSNNYHYQTAVANHELYVPTRSKVVIFGNDDTGIDKNHSLPQSIELLQNYPNPFNPATTIKFYLSENEFVTLAIYDNLGRKIKTLLNEKRAKGHHRVNFDGSELSSGIYYCRLSAGSLISTKKLLLLK